MRAITSVVLLAVFANAFCMMRPLALKSLGTVPITISDCYADARDELFQYQGTWAAQPQAGQTVDVSVTAYSKGPDASVHVTECEVKTIFQGATVNTTQAPVNQDVALGGQLNWEYKQYIPRFSPSGAYILEASFKDSNGKELGCAKVNFNLLPA